MNLCRHIGTKYSYDVKGESRIYLCLICSHELINRNGQAADLIVNMELQYS